MRTLIVDDEEDMRVMLRFLIELSDPLVTVSGLAADGVDALAQWSADPPDIVVIDHRMPGLTGIEVSRLMLAERPDQQIVLFTASYSDTLRAEATEVGITICLSKDEVRRLPDVLRVLAVAREAHRGEQDSTRPAANM